MFMFCITTIIGGLALVAILVSISKNPTERGKGVTFDWRKKLEGENVSMPPWEIFFPKKKPRGRR